MFQAMLEGHPAPTGTVAMAVPIRTSTNVIVIETDHHRRPDIVVVMERQELGDCIGSMIRLRPSAKFFDAEGHDLPAKDYDWRVERQDEVGLWLRFHTGHQFLLPYERINGSSQDPTRSGKCGYLELAGQISIRGTELSFEPLPSN